MEPIKFDPAAASSQRSTANSQQSRQRQALILRCQKALFCAYRTDQYADPEGFMVSLGSVLEQFPDEVVTYVTDPRTGIQRRLKWPPTISEVVDACEEHQEFLKRLRQSRPAVRALSSPFIQAPEGSLANLFVPEGHPRYVGLVEWTKPADPRFWRFGNSSDGRQGLWVCLDVWQNPPAKKQAAE